MKKKPMQMVIHVSLVSAMSTHCGGRLAPEFIMSEPTSSPKWFNRRLFSENRRYRKPASSGAIPICQQLLRRAVYSVNTL